MARVLSEKIGRGPCPSCGESVTFRKSSGGMLTHKCDGCDSTGYAEPGGKAYQTRMATIQRESAPASSKADPEQLPKADPTAPAKTPRSSAFDMSTL